MQRLDIFCPDPDDAVLLPGESYSYLHKLALSSSQSERHIYSTLSLILSSMVCERIRSALLTGRPVTILDLDPPTFVDIMEFLSDAREDVYKPSIFELIAQEQLRDLLQPALKYVLAVSQTSRVYASL